MKSFISEIGLKFLMTFTYLQTITKQNCLLGGKKIFFAV